MVKTLLAQVKEYKRASIITPVFMVLEVLMEILIPTLMAALIDNGVNKGDVRYVCILGCIMAVMAGLSLLFGAAGGGAFALAHEAASAGAEASKFSSMVGLSTANWQEYAGAARLAGVEADELASLMLTLQERAVNAANGEEGDIEILKLMGISAKNARGELKNADSLLLELADRVKQMRDAGEMGKAAGIMNQLGGEEGARLLDLLQNGRAGLLAMRREARACPCG